MMSKIEAKENDKKLKLTKFLNKKNEYNKKVAFEKLKNNDNEDDGKSETQTDATAQPEYNLSKEQIILNSKSSLEKIRIIKEKNDKKINKDSLITDFKGGDQIRSVALKLGMPSAAKKITTVENFLKDLVLNPKRKDPYELSKQRLKEMGIR